MTELTRENTIQTMQDAAERMGLDLEDLQELIGEVLEDCTGKAEALHEAVKTSDTTKIKALAHDIKGSTANYGLLATSKLALQIETKCADSPVDEINELKEHFRVLSGLALDK